MESPQAAGRRRVIGSARSGSGAFTGRRLLPMYDWPEVREATDASLGPAIHPTGADPDRGIDAPQALERDAHPETLWTDPDLLLSQTCGYPYAQRLSRQGGPVGTPAYMVDRCGTRADISAYLLRGRGRRRAIPANWGKALRLQHGAVPVRLCRCTVPGCLPQVVTYPCRNHWKPARTALPFAPWPEARADWAAIDAVTWELAKRHEPAATDLVVFARTPETPALPLISRLKQFRQSRRHRRCSGSGHRGGGH
jgi:hypothetical protein